MVLPAPLAPTTPTTSPGRDGQVEPLEEGPVSMTAGQAASDQGGGHWSRTGWSTASAV